MRNVFIILFLSINILSFPLFGQIKNKGIPFIHHYTSAGFNGVPDCWGVAQDANGIMYFGNNGLLQFDGSRWEMLQVPNNTIVRAIEIDDRSGKIYIGAQGDLGYFFPDSCGKLKFTSLRDKLPDEIQRLINDVWKIVITDDAVVFQDRMAFLIYKNDEFEVVRTYEWMEFVQYVDKELYFSTLNQGLFKLTGNTFQLVENGDYFAGHRVCSVLPLGDGRMLIANEKEGLTIYDGKTFTHWQTDVNEFIMKNQVESGLALFDDYFAFGSWVNGVLIIDKKGRPIQHLNKLKGLLSDIVFGLYQDKHKNLWVTTANGIEHIEINSPYSYYNDKIGTPGTAYSSLVHNDNLYLATNLGIFWKEWKDYEDPIDTSSNFKLVGHAKSQIWGLQVIDNDLIAQMHVGLNKIENNSLQNISSDLGMWKMIPLKNKPGYFLQGCYLGLKIFKKENGQFKFVKKLNGYVDSSRIIEQEEDGTIWVSHAYKGVYKIVLDTDLLDIAKIDFYNSEHGFPSDINIYVERINKEIIFTSPKGIYRYNKEKNFFEPYPFWNDLLGHDSHVKKLVEDKKGNIYYFADDKLGVLYKKAANKYEKNDDLFTAFKGELVKNFEHIYPIDDRNIIIATKDFFVHFDPSMPHDAPDPFIINIRKVELINQRSVFGGNYVNKIGEFVAEQPSEMILDLPYDNNALRFTFSAACFSDINKIEYSYLLEGFDKGWSDWGHESKKDYMNLSEGEYTFMVKARNVYGQITPLTTYTFIVNPPWYRTYYAYAVYLLTFVMVFGLTINLYTRNLRHQNEALENTVKERTKEISAKNIEMEAQNKVLQELNEEKNYLMSVVSHDLKSPINQIKGLAYILQVDGAQSKDEEKEIITKIMDSVARLNKMISEILNSQKIDSGKVDLNIEKVNLSVVVGEIQDNFKVVAKDKNIALNYHAEDNLFACIDKSYFTQVMENLISNALKFSPFDKEIFVNVCTLDTKVRIEVKDQGPGLSEEDQKKLFGRFQRLSAKPTGGEHSSGLGLSIVKKYVELMKGTVRCESQPGEGANFILEFERV